MNDDRVKGKSQQAEEQAREALGNVIKKADDTWEEAKDKLDDLDDKIDEMKEQVLTATTTRPRTTPVKAKRELVGRRKRG